MQFVYKYSGHKTLKIKVYIKGTEWAKQTLKIENTATIEEFKQLVKEEFGITILFAFFWRETFGR